MSGLLFIIAVILALLLVFVASIVLPKSRLSRFELMRLNKAGDEAVGLDAQREDLRIDIISLQRITTAILLVLFVATIIGALGWIIGTVVAVFVALEYGALSRLPVVRKYSADIYRQYEPVILDFVQRYQKVLWWVRSIVPETSDTDINSKVELEHLVTTSHGVLSNDEKSFITSSLAFSERLVAEVMTPRSVVDTIKKNEIMGPLVLDDLHRTGHSRFPVIDGDIDHVVGVLHVRDILTLDTTRKHTSLAESAMDKKVFYIRQDQTLVHALAAFLSTHHHLFIVVNEFRETVGILTLEDTMEALLGREIIDEFDTHDDLRVVAARNPRANNKPSAGTDV